LFSIFDDDRNGYIDKNELMKTYNGMGHELSDEKATELIRSVDKDGDMRIDFNEFSALMKKFMTSKLLEQDDRIEDFRAMFKDADTDYSGYLDPTEVYSCLLKNGIEITREELINLIAEFDVDGDQQIGIDEFVAMMNTSSDLAFADESNKNTYLKIRQKNRLQVTDFMKALKDLPSAFVPSVFHKKWVKESKHRPSDVLKAQLDPRTMTWKDLLPIHNDQFTPE